MRRVAPDVERLMWLIAEDRDPKAIADFEARFPDLKYELAKHIAMVNGLKSAARKAPPHEIPRFVPKYAPLRPAYNRSVYIALAFVLGAVAFGSYAVTAMVSRSEPKPIIRQDQTPPIQSVPDTSTRGNKPLEPPASNNAESTAVTPETHDPALKPTDMDDPLRKPITLDVASAPLEAALAMVCKAAGLNYEMAPGMPQVDVELHYPGVPANEILADLGRKYGFTAFPQERGNVLMIPARPESEAKPTVPRETEEAGARSQKPQKHGGVEGQ